MTLTALPAHDCVIPPSVVYCIGIFGLMMLSLLETILVMYLMEKDDGPPEGKDWTADTQQTGSCAYSRYAEKRNL